MGKGKNTYHEKQQKSIDKEILSRVVDYFINQQGYLLMQMNANRLDEGLRNVIKNKAEAEFQRLGICQENELEAYLDVFEKYIWGYYYLDSLIRDKDISDIKCYEYNRITAKRNGELELTDVSFADEEDYRRFVQMVVTKNEKNLSAVNAKVVFTDVYSDADFILRFNVMSGWLQTSSMPFIHIRKDPKKKLYLDDLVKLGFMTQEQRKYLAGAAKTAKGIYVTGKGSVGKTRLTNALLEEIPKKKSGLVVAESDELFSEHPHFLFQHTIENNGEGKVSYDLKTLATNGLLIDLDYFIISEIKGDEAAAFSLASYTGHTCWATGHGASARDGIEKLADYIQRATGDSVEKCYKVLSKMEVVVYLEDFRIKEIVEVKGFDKDHLVFQDIFGGAAEWK
ncbi:MAG: CpaF family protein [Lachnospiraceae bacterium]|nr:CpaF family protein [Lachnospiraceae bacterium]